MMKGTVYILPIVDAQRYIRNKYPKDEEKINEATQYVDEGMTEQECIEIIHESESHLADSYTIKEFQAEFNFAIDTPITSDKYYIKIF